MPAETERVFFDTNVLLYLLSEDIAKSRELDAYLLAGGMISVQVLNEFTNVGRRKRGLHVTHVRPFLAVLQKMLVVVPISVETHQLGLDVIERYRLATYDAMIVAAALLNDCNTLLSEDMQDGMSIHGKLRIKNPFSA